MQRYVGVLLGILVLPALAACRPSETTRAAEMEGIRQSLQAYLPRLGEAYATGDATLLEGYAVEKEVASVARRIRELAHQGILLEPTLKELTLEEVEVWSHANAYATTVEVWDIRELTVGSGTLISEELNQRSRVKYQLKREGDRWLILYRQLEKTFR